MSFTPRGVTKFRRFLNEIRSSTTYPGGITWIHDPDYAQTIDSGTTVKEVSLGTKLEAGKYLADKLEHLTLSDKYYHQGLWAWLGAFYFDDLCPGWQAFENRPGRDHRYIPTSSRDWNNIYRHLLAGPARIYAVHGAEARILLSGTVSVLGDAMEQLASRQEIASTLGILQAADILYWNSELEGLKRGARATGGRPGSLRRFVKIIRQFQQTYDLGSMSGPEIIQLLPKPEFEEWV